MSTDEETLAELKAERDRLFALQTKRNAKLHKTSDRIGEISEEIRRLEVPPQPSTTVITFEKLFRTGPRRTYEYAAIRAGRLWYVTGASTKGYTWHELVAFIRQDSTLPFFVRPMHSLAQCDPPF